MKAVLQRKYDPEDNSEETKLCKARQEAISRKVRGTNYTWGIAGASAGMVAWSF